MSLDNDVLNLDPLLIPGMVTPVVGADGGVNHNLIHINEGGLLVSLPPYQNMTGNDWIQVFWGNDDTPVAADLVLDDQVGKPFSLFVPAAEVPEGVQALYATVTRSGGGNGGSTLPLDILVRTLKPGGTDPDPAAPGHQNLLPPEPDLPPDGIIDEDAAQAGVSVSIASYPNIRIRDVITLSWGGEYVRHEVTQADLDAGALSIRVEEAVIRAAGDGELALMYRVRDEVHNLSSDWSERTLVTVEIGEGLFDPPLIENPDPDADPYDVIDLDRLGDDDLLIDVMVYRNGFELGDVVTLSWVGTTAQGQPVTFTPEPETVTRDPQSLPFIIPNADLRVLGGGRGVASYTVTREGVAVGGSRRAFASFRGAEQLLPKPRLPDAVNGVLDPALTTTSIEIPGDGLGASDTLIVTWLGIRANGSPLLHEFQRTISGGNAGKPVTLPVDGATLLAPLDGGSVTVSYRVKKFGSDIELLSEREQVQVGEARAELPAPTTRPAAEGGVLDPENVPVELEIVIAPWPGMKEGQRVHLVWTASSGPAHNDFIDIGAPAVGHEVVFYMERGTLDQYLDARVQVAYRVESEGETPQLSETANFSVSARPDIGSGPMRVMGARFTASKWRPASAPRKLKAFHDSTLQPMLAEWRYDDETQWTAGTQWLDVKPALKLYVRNRTETWMCWPANIHGNGFHQDATTGMAAFVAMRDEVTVGSEVVVDMVAWGDKEYGGELDSSLIALGDVVEISATLSAFTARLRDGSAVCWGHENGGGKPPVIHEELDLIRSNTKAFVARRTNGELLAWGATDSAVPVPDKALQYRDYVELYGGSFAFAARRANGKVVSWGVGGEMEPGQDEFSDITQLAANDRAFLALRDNADGTSVIAWGLDGHGASLPEDIARLNNVQSIGASTYNTFCILLKTGQVRVWPVAHEGGQIPDEIARLRNIVEITATQYAYCALLTTGRVVAWGTEARGGKLTNAVIGKSNIVQVVANVSSFAALCSDGSVVAWGDPATGGDISSVATKLVNVRAIYANQNAFTALTKNGSVVTWGIRDGGGNSDHVQHLLAGKVTHSVLLAPDDAEQGPSSIPVGLSLL